MIHIDRSSVPVPVALMGTVAAERRRAAEEFFARSETKREQRRFDFNLKFAHPHLGRSLRELFNDKCAYCEKYVPADKVGVAFLDRFRPVSGAIGLDGKVTVDGYWWLAYEWNNMYGCCAMCNRAKGSRFPVAGARLTFQGPGGTDAEKPLLLDPCVDNPDDHLLFHDDGSVSGTTDRGRHTVEILALNRTELLGLRGEAAREMVRIRDSWNPNRPLTEDYLDSTLPFTAMRRQILLRAPQPSADEHARQEGVRQQQVIHESKNAATSLAAPKRMISRERGRTRYIEAVILRNIGVHEELHISMRGADSTSAPWLVLLGENGVGKSTLLKAIGFALAGQSQWRRLGPLATGLLPSRSVGSDIGVVEIFLTDGEVLQLEIDPVQKEITGTATEAKLYALGFGATRLPPTARHKPPEEPTYLRLLNLFDPFSPLGDAQQWLSTRSPLQFERAGRTLRSLLDLPARAVFQKIKGGGVCLNDSGVLTPIDRLSDGYQTVIGVGCDIMSVLLQSDLPVEYAEGIVLIDEIGNHLHPSWRMRIVSALKEAFPRVQFIVTTHEPLCLRGLDNDEVAVLRRDEGKVKLLIDLPPIKGLLVDQILSSQYFGMSSTVDPKFKKELDEYYELVSKREPTESESARLSELEPMMNRVRLIGDTPQEQILLRTIDTYVQATDAAGAPIDPANLPKAVQDELLDLLGDMGHPGAPE